jgi:hypothetical protein
MQRLPAILHLTPKQNLSIMKKIFSSLGWILLLLPLISVAGARTAIAINEKIAIDEDREVSGFTGVASSGPFDVYIKLGSKESLRLEGDEEVIVDVVTKVEKGILLVHMKKNKIIRNFNHKVKVYITAQSLESLTVSGSGNMQVDGRIKADDFAATVSGSGNLDMILECDNLAASISGSGRINTSGSSDNAHIVISGSGNFDGKKFETNEADIKVSGSGNASIHADDSLSAILSGSGNIRYSGNAKVNLIKSGSGGVRKI